MAAATPFKVVNLAMPPAPAGPLSFFCGGGEVTKASDKKSLLSSLPGASSPVNPAPEPRVRTSQSLPVMAAAAAIAGDIKCVRPPLP